MWATMRVCERVGGLTGQVLGSGGGGVKAWEGVGSDLGPGGSNWVNPN